MPFIDLVYDKNSVECQVILQIDPIYLDQGRDGGWKTNIKFFVAGAWSFFWTWRIKDDISVSQDIYGVHDRFNWWFIIICIFF